MGAATDMDRKSFSAQSRDDFKAIDADGDKRVDFPEFWTYFKFMRHVEQPRAGWLNIERCVSTLSPSFHLTSVLSMRFRRNNGGSLSISISTSISLSLSIIISTGIGIIISIGIRSIWGALLTHCAQKDQNSEEAHAPRDLDGGRVQTGGRICSPNVSRARRYRVPWRATAYRHRGELVQARSRQRLSSRPILCYQAMSGHADLVAFLVQVNRTLRRHACVHVAVIAVCARLTRRVGWIRRCLSPSARRC